MPLNTWTLPLNTNVNLAESKDGSPYTLLVLLDQLDPVTLNKNVLNSWMSIPFQRAAARNTDGHKRLQCARQTQYFFTIWFNHYGVRQGVFQLEALWLSFSCWTIVAISLWFEYIVLGLKSNRTASRTWSPNVPGHFRHPLPRNQLARDFSSVLPPTPNARAE